MNSLRNEIIDLLNILTQYQEPKTSKQIYRLFLWNFPILQGLICHDILSKKVFNFSTFIWTLFIISNFSYVEMRLLCPSRYWMIFRIHSEGLPDIGNLLQCQEFVLWYLVLEIVVKNLDSSFPGIERRKEKENSFISIELTMHLYKSKFKMFSFFSSNEFFENDRKFSEAWVNETGEKRA